MNKEEATILIAFYKNSSPKQRMNLDTSRDSNTVKLRQLICDAYELQNTTHK